MQSDVVERKALARFDTHDITLNRTDSTLMVRLKGTIRGECKHMSAAYIRGNEIVSTKHKPTTASTLGLKNTLVNSLRYGAR